MATDTPTRDHIQEELGDDQLVFVYLSLQAMRMSIEHLDRPGHLCSCGAL